MLVKIIGISMNYRPPMLLSGLLFLVALTVFGVSSAATLELQPTRDIWTTSVYAYDGENHFSGIGGGQNNDILWVGGWGDEYRSLLLFDLSAVSSPVISATLQLYHIGSPDGRHTPVGMYLDRVTSDWDWTTEPLDAGTLDNERLWWDDRPSYVNYVASLPVPGIPAVYEVDVTDLVNGQIAGTYANHGFQLRAQSTWADFNYFASSEHANASWRPKLILEIQDEVNAPPVAAAGDDQSIRAGDPATLDGTGSFDDNDPLSALSATWAIASGPAGSLASIDDTGSFTPVLTTDLAGTYVLSLTVADTAGLTSAPDEVFVSTDNLAPAAVIDFDPVVVEGSVVSLDGSSSTDPENDPLSFSWTLSVPAGSSAVLSDSTGVSPTFVADTVGDYLATLSVSDIIGPGAPVAAAVTSISAEDYASGLVDDAESLVDSLSPSEVTTQGNSNALTNFLQQAVAAIQGGDIDEAISKLENALGRVDGCAERGAPDGNGAGRDWVTSCSAQAPIYDALSEALATIQP